MTVLMEESGNYDRSKLTHGFEITCHQSDRTPRSGKRRFKYSVSAVQDDEYNNNNNNNNDHYDTTTDTMDISDDGIEDKENGHRGATATTSTTTTAAPAGAGQQQKQPQQEPCSCRLGKEYCLPPVDTKLWPQAPLLCRPDPKSGTKILGIRREKHSTSEYLWKPGSTKSWSTVLQQQWDAAATAAPTSKRKNNQTSSNHATQKAAAAVVCCPYCVILPINNGNEGKGESLVADFESELFRGTLLLRLRHAEGTTPTPSDDTKGFFAGVPFRYETVIRGTFKQSIPYTELVTGTKLSRPCGKLPPKWALWTAKKVIAFFAPQLKMKLVDIDQPYVLTPFGSAPRVVEVHDTATNPPTDYLGDERVEPTIDKMSLTGKAYDIKDPLERARARKRAFDKLYILASSKDNNNKDNNNNNNKQQQQSTILKTDPTKTYTMEFLQHLLDYQKLSIDLGTTGGSFEIAKLLDGQPLQFMAAHNNNGKFLFNFEIWNECLMEDALKHAAPVTAARRGVS